MSTDTLKTAICDALATWIRQRPGLDPADYIDTDSRGETRAQGEAYFRSAQRELGRDKRDAETLLAAARYHGGVTAEVLQDAFKQSFGGRLECKVTDVMSAPQPIQHGAILERPPAHAMRQVVELDYTAGQNETTEYRAAAAAVLARALWIADRDTADGYGAGFKATAGRDPEANELRQHFRKQFGSGVQRRWFN